MKNQLFSIVFCFVFQFSTAQDLLSQKKSDRLYQSGIDLLARDEYGAARKAFEEFLGISSQQDLRRSDAEYYQALCGLSLYNVDGEKLMGNFVAANRENPHASTANYDLGNFYYSDKNYSKAAFYFGRVEFASLSGEQQNNGRFRWGYSLFSQRKLKEALDEFNFIKTQGGQYGPAASYYSGFIEYSQGDYALALTDLTRAEQNPAYARIVPYHISAVYYKQKDYSGLLNYVSALKDFDKLSNHGEIALLSAEAHFKKDDFRNALTGYQQYMADKASADRGVLSRAGYSAYQTGDEKLALEYFKSAASDQDSVGFYSSYYLGAIYLKQNQKPLALTAFDNARKLKSDPRLSEESSFQCAKISYDLGRSDDAISEFEKFMVAFPSSHYTTEVKELLSQAYVNANNYNKAIEYIESLPRRGPNIDRAYQKATYLKGADLFNRGDYAQAVRFFGRSLENPLDISLVADADFWSAEAYSIGKKYDQAIAGYEGIFSLSQYSNREVISRARYGLGYCYYNQQKYDKALLNFKEFANLSSKANSNYSDGILRLGDCFYISKNYSEALVNYKKAIALNSPDADYAHLQSGVILGIQHNYPEAAGELDLVIKNFPNSRYFDESVFERAQFFFEQGNYVGAVSEFGQIIGADKPSRFLPYAFQRRAAANYNLKEYSKTADDYIVLMDKFPTHSVTAGLLTPLQEALNLSGRSAEFDKYLAQFKASNPNAKGIESIEFEAAKNYYFNQDYPKAITSLTNYATAYPESARLQEANYYRAESMFRLNDFTNALASYYQIKTDNSFAFTNRVISRIAELEFKAGHYDKAVPQFQRLAKIATSKKDQYNSWSGLMESYYLLTQYDSSDTYARLILEKGKVNAGAENKASLYLGKTAMARGDYETAKDEFLSTLNTARDEYGAEAKYLLAEIFYLNKDHKQCYETLISLNVDFVSYTDWVGKSYLLLADNYIAMGETFQAKGTLRSLIENFPTPQIKELATEKLKKLEEEELKKQHQQIEQDSANTKKN